MPQRLALLFLGFVCLTSAVRADLVVQVEAPGLQDGMAALESMLAAQTDQAALEIAGFVDGLVQKPQFMKGFSAAAAALLPLPGLSLPGGRWLLSVGSLASIHSASPLNQLPVSLAAMNEESDVEIGFSSQPLVLQLSLPLDCLLPGLDLSLQGGYLEAGGDKLGLSAYSAGASAGWQFAGSLSAEGRRAFWFWPGIRLSAGYSFAHSSLKTLVQPGRISQTVMLDPDDEGPLVPFSVTLVMDPDIWVGMVSDIHVLKLQAATALEVFRLFSLGGGVGLSWQLGGSGISVDMRDELAVEGYLAQLIDDNDPGTVTVSGTSEASAYSSFAVYLFTVPAFIFGAFRMQLPLLWSLPYGLSGGLLLEFRL